MCDVTNANKRHYLCKRRFWHYLCRRCFCVCLTKDITYVKDVSDITYVKDVSDITYVKDMSVCVCRDSHPSSTQVMSFVWKDKHTQKHKSINTKNRENKMFSLFTHTNRTHAPANAHTHKLTNTYTNTQTNTTQYIHREVGGWGRDPKKCTGRNWGMGSSTI